MYNAYNLQSCNITVWLLFKTFIKNKNDVPEEVQVLVDNVAAQMVQLHEKTSLKSLERKRFRGKMIHNSEDFSN